MHPRQQVSVTERLLQDLADTFSASGDAFFRNLVLQLVKALRVDFAIVVEIDAAGADSARTVAVCDRGRIMENFEYPVAGTPCEETLRAGVFATHPRDLARLFPKAPLVIANGFDAYIGIPLQDEGEEILGLLAVLHRGPIEKTRLTQSLLRILSARAAVELERSRVGERIRRSQDTYLKVLDDFPTPIWRSDLKGRCDFFNRAWLQFRGRTLAEELGTGFVEGMPPEDLERLRARFLVALREQKPFEIEGRLRRHDGELRTLVDVGRPYFDTEGRFAGFVGACYDITERKQSEEALRSSESRFRRLIECVPDAIVVQQGGRIVFANPSAARLLGWEHPGDLIGEPILPIVHMEEREEIMEIVRRAVHAGEPSTPGEYRCVRRDGSIGYGEFQIIPIEFDGKPSILVAGRDVTERREMQAQLLQADRLAALGTLAAGVAHEMNNPLSYVLSNLKFLSEELPRFRQEARRLEWDAHILPADEDQPPPEKVRWRDIEETLADAIEGAERVRVIVRDLKTFTRLDDEKQDSLDVRKILDSTLNLAWNEIHPRARLRRDYQDVPSLQANEGRLGQVFLNLLMNAAQALPPGGGHRNEIRVVTRTDAEGNAVVEIHDTGPGIPPEILPRVFDPFFTTKPVGQGTGLGLSICHHLVTGLGGSIRIESRAGQGTCVRVTLLAAPPSP